MNQAEALAGAYGTIAEWLLYPEEIDPAAIDADAADRAASAAGELPDYLPAMVEFLALSSGCEGEEDEALRRRFIARMVVPGARIFADRLEEIGTIYEHLARALLICLEQEVGEQEVAEAAAEGAPPEGADMRAKVVTFD